MLNRLAAAVRNLRLRNLLNLAQAYAPGLAFCLLIAASAAFLSQNHGGPVVLYALLLGMPFHFLMDNARLSAGVALAARGVLRLGVALLGARITLEQILKVGLPITLAIAVSVLATVAFGWLVARRLGFQAQFGVLSAGATAICGASAAAAISAVLPRYPTLERDTAFTIIGVTTLSTVAMVLYPAIAKWAGFSATETGIFLGATIHDVAQVVGAGYAVSVEAGDKATIVKLFRVVLLLPLVLTIALVARRSAGTNPDRPASLIPWFLTAFAGLVAANSLGLISEQISTALGSLSRWCIVVAIAALGVRTALASFFDVGRTAVAILFAETVFLAVFFSSLMFLLR